jgi:hypothetical protein
MQSVTTHQSGRLFAQAATLLGRKLLCTAGLADISGKLPPKMGLLGLGLGSDHGPTRRNSVRGACGTSCHRASGARHPLPAPCSAFALSSFIWFPNIFAASVLARVGQDTRCDDLLSLKVCLKSRCA